MTRDRQILLSASRTSDQVPLAPCPPPAPVEWPCQVVVTFDDSAATWYIACGLPGPAGQTRLHLGEGVILAVDRTDSRRALELSVALPDGDDPSGTPTAEAVGLVEALFGTEAAKLSTTPAGQASGTSWEVPLEFETRCARTAACRLALLTEARDDVDDSDEASLWSAEAALLARLIAPALEPVVRAEAPAGARALRGLSDSVCHRLPATVREDLCPVVAVLRSVVGGDPLLDRFSLRSPQLDWVRDLDSDKLSRLVTTIWQQRQPDASDEPSGTGVAAVTDECLGGDTSGAAPANPRAVALPGERLDLLDMKVLWDAVTRTFELRATVPMDGPDRDVDGMWARAYQYHDGALLALQRAQLIDGVLVARLSVPSDVDVSSVCVDLVSEPGYAPPSAELHSYQTAIQIGRMAATMDRQGRWAEAAARWTECAEYWHSQLGDTQRAAMAFACAARSYALRAEQLSRSKPKAAARDSQAAIRARQRAQRLATSWAATFVRDPGDTLAPFLAEVIQPLLGQAHHERR